MRDGSQFYFRQIFQKALEPKNDFKEVKIDKIPSLLPLILSLPQNFKIKFQLKFKGLFNY